MISEDKVSLYLSLQQTVLDIDDTSKLLQQFLPQVLSRLLSVGLSYEFISAIFVDSNQQIKQTFFVDQSFSQTNSSIQIINIEKIFQKGSNWEMEIMYGTPVLIADINQFINTSYLKFSSINSLLIFPIQNAHKLSGILVLASSIKQNDINQEEAEFLKILTNLVDLGFRLQDTQISLTQITSQVYEMNAKLHQLDKLKDDFVSIASHELRTPMTAIRSYVWMALHRSDIPLSQKLERYLYRTLVSTERLINLVNDMLNVSRIESGRVEINPQGFDLVALVKDVFEEVKVKGDEKKLQLLIMDHKIPPVFGDPDKVHQVLLNLVGNALKFTYPGGVISIDFFTEGKMIEVSIKDNGLGINKEDLNKLFHKFSRLDNSYTAISTSGGTGLGLFISKSLIELMHGKIWATSEGFGKGSTFIFSLPIADKNTLEHAEEYKIKPEGEAKPLEPVAI